MMSTSTRKRAPIGMLLLLAALGNGCHTPTPTNDGVGPLTPQERTQMQSCTYHASRNVVLAATVAVLQDLGWKLDTVDHASGLIRASTEHRLEPLGPKEEKGTNFEYRRQAIKKRGTEKNQWTRWEEMVIHTEPWPGGTVRQRIVLSRCGSLPALSYEAKIDGQQVMINAPPREERVELELADVYADIFRRITFAVAERNRP